MTGPGQKEQKVPSTSGKEEPGNPPSAQASDLVRQSIEDVNRRIINSAEKIIADEERFLDRAAEMRGTDKDIGFYKAVSEGYLQTWTQLRESVDEICRPLGYYNRHVQSSKFPDEKIISEMSDEQKSAMIYSYIATKTPTGSMLLKETEKSGAAICLIETDVFQGSYLEEDNVIVLNSPDFNSGTVTANELKTFYEELWHSAQAKRWGMDISDKNVLAGRNTYKDDIINTLGMEAHAKVGAAFMIMEHADHEAPEWRQEMLEYYKNPENKKDRNVFLAVNDAYEKHGLAAIRAAPSLLAPAFEAFFRDESCLEDYADGYFYELEKMRILQPARYEKSANSEITVSAKEFTRTFGQFLGKDGMLDGHYRQQDDITNMLPEDSKLRIWLTGEFNPNAMPPESVNPSELKTSPGVKFKPD